MLTEMTINEFTALLASDAPAPGGGSTAALAGALGVSLTRMVAALTAGKPKYAEHQALMDQLMAEAGTLRAELLDLLDRDTEAFNGVTAVFAMPRGTDEEKAVRADAMQRALKACTETPAEMMRCALAALKLTEQALGRSNPNAASDLGVAALSLGAAVRGAWLNVLINLGGIRDEGFTARHRADGEAVLAEATALAERIYRDILGSL